MLGCRHHARPVVCKVNVINQGRIVNVRVGRQVGRVGNIAHGFKARGIVAVEGLALPRSPAITPSLQYSTTPAHLSSMNAKTEHDFPLPRNLRVLWARLPCGETERSGDASRVIPSEAFAVLASWRA
jgi:hypothetical protein